ncbi:MAG: BlaI/MecI/CopY family transcriptional regulator [Saprospiraceae bacterium]
MKKLTKAEEEIMQIIWELDRCIVKDIREKMGDPLPKHSTISSIVRILEGKGFLDHKAYGRTYEYFPIISKEAYSKKSLKDLVSNYFEGSMDRLVSFMVDENEMDIKALSELIDEKETEDPKKKSKK